MIARTHAAIGAAAGVLLAAHTGHDPVMQVGAGIVAGIAALLPDRIEWGIPHRTLTHNICIPAALLLIPHPAAPIIALGYASHILADCLTLSGVPVLWPLPFRVRLGRIRTGGWVDRLIGLVSLGVILWHILS